MNNPFDYTPDEACSRTFAKLLDWIETQKGSNRDDVAAFCHELDEGKMLGVLMAEDEHGGSHALYAFSGQLGDAGFNAPDFCRKDDGWCPEFVGPVFDYLQSDGYFRLKEVEISGMNAEIRRFQDREYARATADYQEAKSRLDTKIAAYKEECRKSKLERDAKRRSGIVDDAGLASLLRQSQFEKAELRRLKKRAEAELKPFTTALEAAQRRLEEMKERRRMESEALQQWLFTNFTVLNARGESKSLTEIFSGTSLKVPPSGAGECCAPKLLQAAYKRGWMPVSMAEYWYGRPKGGEIRVHGRHYPACRGKCLPVLTWMLQGLEVMPPLDCESGRCFHHEPEIIFQNEYFCVVDKPSGMLSVPGKGNALSVQQWLIEKFGDYRGVKVAHRLDQDTSGLLIATFGDRAYKSMQGMFARREVKKTYVAELEGDYKTCGLPRSGRIELPLAPDWLDRPRQRVDFELGKEAATDYEFSGVCEGRSRVVFHPHTGRTHQLRVHAASEQGLGMPIAGDRLYGTVENLTDTRLRLHAHHLEFTFPLDGRSYLFESPMPF